MPLRRAHTARRAQAGAPDAALEALLHSGPQLCLVAAVALLCRQVQWLCASMAELQRKQDEIAVQIQALQHKSDALERETEALKEKVATTEERVDAMEVRVTMNLALIEQLAETRILQLLAENAMLRALLDARER